MYKQASLAYEYHKFILLKTQISNAVSLVHKNGLQDLISNIILNSSILLRPYAISFNF